MFGWCLAINIILCVVTAIDLCFSCAILTNIHPNLKRSQKDNETKVVIVETTEMKP